MIDSQIANLLMAIGVDAEDDPEPPTPPTENDLIAEGLRVGLWDVSEGGMFQNDDGTTAASDGDDIGYLPDQWGVNPLIMETPEYRPEYATDGTAHWLIGTGDESLLDASVDLEPTHTVVIAVDVDDVQDSTIASLFSYNGDTGDYQFEANSLTAFQGRLNSLGLGLSKPVSPLPISGAVVVTLQFDEVAGVARLYVDGALAFEQSGYDGNLAENGMFRIMSNRDGGVYLKGKFYYCCIWNGLEGRTGIEAIAAAKLVGASEGDAPTVTSAGTITGSTAVGNEMSVTGFNYTGMGTVTYAWKRDGSPISGATSATYTTVSADIGTTLTRTTTVTNAGGSDNDTTAGVSITDTAETDVIDVSDRVLLFIPAEGGMFQNSNGTTAAAADDPAGYMPDQFGSRNALQSESARRPTVRTGSGLTWLEADGSNDRMEIAGVPLGPSHTVVVAVDIPTGANGPVDAIFSYDGATGDYQIDNTGATNFTPRLNPTSLGFYNTDAASSATGKMVLSLVCDDEAGTMTLYKDGVQIIQSTAYNGNMAATGSFKLFANRGGGGTVRADLYYLCAWNTAASRTEIEAIANGYIGL